MTLTAEKKEQLIDDLLFHITVIKPLSDIVEGLENDLYRDVDIDWLDTKRMEFVNLAIQALKIDIPQDFKVDKTEGVMNNMMKAKFLYHFKTLKEFFESYE